jgi:hypothetical protein
MLRSIVFKLRDSHIHPLLYYLYFKLKIELSGCFQRMFNNNFVGIPKFSVELTIGDRCTGKENTFICQ